MLVSAHCDSWLPWQAACMHFAKIAMDECVLIMSVTDSTCYTGEPDSSHVVEGSTVEAEGHQLVHHNDGRISSPRVWQDPIHVACRNNNSL